MLVVLVEKKLKVCLAENSKLEMDLWVNFQRSPALESSFIMLERGSLWKYMSIVLWLVVISLVVILLGIWEVFPQLLSFCLALNRSGACCCKKLLLGSSVCALPILCLSASLHLSNLCLVHLLGSTACVTALASQASMCSSLCMVVPSVPCLQSLTFEHKLKANASHPQPKHTTSQFCHSII